MNYLVTGAGRGIGRGLVRHLLQDGHRVFLTDANVDELAHTAQLAKGWSQGRIDAFSTSKVDLSDRTALMSLSQSVRAFCRGDGQSGRLDVLVNNAFATPHTWADGKGLEDPEADIEAQWDLKLAVGLTAPFLLSRAFVPLLANPSGTPGSIINITSTRAHQAEDNHEAYSACKGGLLGLTQSMSVSLGHRHKIRVNAISPGWISVDNENKEADKQGTKWEEGMSETDHRWHPAGRVGKVSDIYEAVRFLSDSTFMTGQEIVVDGGVTKKMVYPE